MFHFVNYSLFIIPSVVAYYSIIMEKLKFASVFILFYIQFSEAISADFMIAEAIESILNEHFVKSAWTVEAINFGQSADVLETVLRLKRDSVAVKVTRVKNCESLSLSHPSILFFGLLYKLHGLLYKHRHKPKLRGKAPTSGVHSRNNFDGNPETSS